MKLPIISPDVRNLFLVSSALSALTFVPSIPAALGLFALVGYLLGCRFLDNRDRAIEQVKALTVDITRLKNKMGLS